MSVGLEANSARDAGSRVVDLKTIAGQEETPVANELVPSDTGSAASSGKDGALFN